MSERLYVAQFVVAVENLWFAPGTDNPPIRTDRRYSIAAQLFAAPDAEGAYLTACGWLTGFSDANHDGPGDLTRMFALGIHQLEVLPALTPTDLPSAVRGLYGVDVGSLEPGAVDPSGVPLVRDKAALAIFRWPSA